MTIKEFEAWAREHWPPRSATALGWDVPSHRPVRRKTIPKEGGGERLLGIPNVVERLIPQAICQVLTPIFDPTFSESSFGFRPADRPTEPRSEYNRSSGKVTLIAPTSISRNFSTEFNMTF